MLDVTLRFARTRCPIEARFSLERLNAGLFGPSGCGKTSLLRLLSGHWTPESGRVMLGGDLLFDSRRVINRLPGPPLIALVDREERLDPRVTVHDHLLSLRKGRSGPENGLDPDEVIELLDLEALLPFRSGFLSTGESIRLRLGRALLAAPRLLLLDESLSSVDQQLRTRILDGLR
jgi:molybdate transport system ATP-binding protein